MAVQVSASPIVLNFDSLPGIANSNGTDIPTASQLNNQYLSSYGVSFGSTLSFAAVVNLGAGVATSGTNGIAGTDGNLTLSYDPNHPVVATFYNPANPYYEAVTNYVSVRADTNGHGANVTLEAFDINGTMIGSNTVADAGGETLSVTVPGIHSVEFLGSDSGDGVAIDDFTFNPVTPVQRVVLNFDERSGGLTFLEGNTIPDSAKISTQYVTPFGVRFSSGSNYASLVAYPNLTYTTSGYNGLGGSTPEGNLTYDSDYPTMATFVDPANPANPAITDFVSLRGDLIGTKNTNVTLNAYDKDGNLIGSDTELDFSGEYLAVSAPGIHSIKFFGNHGTNIGVGIDDFTFGVVATFPTAPSGLTATPGNAQIGLKWTAGPGASSYNIYRGVSPGGEASTPVQSGVTASSITDTGLTNGTTYYYQVSAVNALGTSVRSTEVSATPVAPHATFVGVDATTQGNWRDKYGVSGFNVIGDTSTGNPHYGTGIAVTPGAHNSGIWAASSLSPTCLQPAASGSANRLAGIWYQTSWTMNVSSTGAHQIELYLLDLNNAGYAETITIKDANTGAVLNTQTASNFQGGKYYIWNVSGNVNVTFTSTAGHWAVLSGIFLGGATGSKSPTQPTNLTATQSTSGIGLAWTASTGATSYNIYRGTTSTAELTTPIATGIKTTSYTNSGLTPGATYYYKVVALNSYAGSFASTEASAVAPSPTATATFVTADTLTHGNWKGVYGIDGYNIIGDTSGPNPAYPAYATVTAGTHTSGVWSSTSTDPKALQKISATATTRIAGVWYNTAWSTSVNVTGTHKLALYFLDYPNAGYAETITIKDAATGAVLDTRSVSGFQNGVYEVWNVSGNVTITLTSTAGHWAPLSGIFFG